jgi:hypothetical protein
MKILKKITTLVLTMVMTFMMVEGASAATFPWTTVKNPGSSGCQVDDVQMPIYAGTITFKVTNLTGNCSYQVAIASSTYSSKYYVNNSQRCVKVSKLNGESSFSMKFTNTNISTETYMYIRCSMEHNANIGDTVTTSGILYN